MIIENNLIVTKIKITNLKEIQIRVQLNLKHSNHLKNKKQI